jgi:hypothetical protein
MAIVEEVHERSAGVTISTAPPYTLKRRATREFVVRDSAPLTESDVIALGPSLGSSHPRIPGLIALSKDVAPMRPDGRAWTLRVQYDEAEPLQGQQQYQENPLLRPPQLQWSTTQFEEDFIKSVDGKAVVNSAGDYFDPPIRVQRSRWQCHYQKNVASVPTWLLNYVDAINSDSFLLGGLTISQRAAKLDAISIQGPKFENGVTYYELGYTFTFCRSGESWQPKILDQGMYELVTSGNQTFKRRIRYNGEPVTSPVLLDGEGKPLWPVSPESAVWLTYKAYQELSFANIL